MIIIIKPNAFGVKIKKIKYANKVFLQLFNEGKVVNFQLLAFLSSARLKLTVKLRKMVVNYVLQMSKGSLKLGAVIKQHASQGCRCIFKRCCSMPRIF